MQNLPQVGKTYVSQADPRISIYVERMDHIEADGDDPGGFCVIGCDPKDIGNQSADGIEIFDDEWEERGFHLVT